MLLEREHNHHRICLQMLRAVAMSKYVVLFGVSVSIADFEYVLFEQRSSSSQRSSEIFQRFKYDANALEIVFWGLVY